ncbi:MULTISPECIES: hypothetical protein [unclassified Janthinobacterium]|uniref:hypothetical protein n=1 Tax=unclassified Janthinobacterium TaxID=2610881 RepID=UPI0012F8C69C|nr:MULTISPECIES: hypothetical protein [unclassified Janthinobacterium]MEC5161528.1 hypothetical protein [Janthinobacterium sp. CG_S6]
MYYSNISNFLLKRAAGLHFLIRLHFPWLMSVVLFFLSIGISLRELPEMDANNYLLAHKKRSLETRLHTSVNTSIVKVRESFGVGFAPYSSLPAVISSFQDLSTKNGLELLEASYRPGSDVSNTRFGRIEINARLKGAYRPLKKVLAELLMSHEGLALEGVSLRRNRSVDAVLDMELRFTFFYRKDA